MKIGNVFKRLSSLWRKRAEKLLELHNGIRFSGLARKKNVRVSYGKNLRFARKAVFRLEGNGGALTLGNKVMSHGTTTVVLAGEGKLEIGDRVYMNDGVMISCLGNVKVGAGTLIGPHVSIFDNNHLFGREGVRVECRPGSIKIGRNCWIGAHAVILDGAVIGDNCVIGAGCLIKDEVPENTVVTLHQDQHRRKIQDEPSEI